MPHARVIDERHERDRAELRDGHPASGSPRRAWGRWLSAGLGLVMMLGPVTHVRAAEDPTALSLHMRAPPAEPRPDPPRGYSGPTAVKDEPGREVTWESPVAGPVEPAPPERAGEAVPPPEPVTATVPPPSSIRDVPEHVRVAIGLGPQAPGTREERALLEALEAGITASSDPTAEVRRLRPGRGARRVCRERRDALVVTIGYVADRPTPVVLAHDCALDRALGIRAADAAVEPGLVGALWAEHHELLREGVRARRRATLGPRARGGIIAGVAVVVVGVAVGALVANALREESVVITVRP